MVISKKRDMRDGSCSGARALNVWEERVWLVSRAKFKFGVIGERRFEGQPDKASYDVGRMMITDSRVPTWRMAKSGDSIGRSWRCWPGRRLTAASASPIELLAWPSSSVEQHNQFTLIVSFGYEESGLVWNPSSHELDLVREALGEGRKGLDCTPSSEFFTMRVDPASGHTGCKLISVCGKYLGIFIDDG